MLIQWLKFHWFVPGLTNAAVQHVGYNQTLITLILSIVTEYLQDVGHVLGMFTTYCPAAEATYSVSRSITSPTIHYNPPSNVSRQETVFRPANHDLRLLNHHPVVDTN
jgi:hypothetical protein